MNPKILEILPKKKEHKKEGKIKCAVYGGYQCTCGAKEYNKAIEEATEAITESIRLAGLGDEK